MAEAYARYAVKREIQTKKSKKDISVKYFFSEISARDYICNYLRDIAEQQGIPTEVCEKAFARGHAYLEIGNTKWEFSIIEIHPEDIDAFNRHLFRETHSMAISCLAALEDKRPLTPDEFNRADYLFCSLLCFFRAENIIQGYDSMAAITYLYDRHMGALASENLQKAMADNPGSHVWEFDDLYAIRWLDSGDAIFCGAMETSYRDRPYKYMVCAFVIPKELRIGKHDKQALQEFANEYWEFYGVRLSGFMDSSSAIKKVHEFTKGPWGVKGD